MTVDAGPPPENGSGEPGDATTRRAFLGNVGRKAAFAIPVILSLTAQEAQAAPSGAATGSSTAAAGESCWFDSDCQSALCTGGVCAP
jgi:hypothetical protein